MSQRDVQKEIQELVSSAQVVLFMKGSKSFPQCGFSATVVQILGGLIDDYQTVNVLSDPDVREGIKQYSNWPTIPQLYVEGEFVGGCDIVREMYQTGDLQKVLGVDVKDVEPPEVTMSDKAAEVLKNALDESDEGDVVHLSVDAKFRADLHIAPAGAADVRVEGLAVPLVVDVGSVDRARGVAINFIEQRGQAGFKIDNPNAPAEVVDLSAAELKAKLDAGEIKELFDVRTAQERERAVIADTRMLDDDTMRYIESLDRSTPVAFYCHHGQRSMAAAQHFRDQGFREIYNLAGGIDAWSQLVDPKVPRY